MQLRDRYVYCMCQSLCQVGCPIANNLMHSGMKMYNLCLSSRVCINPEHFLPSCLASCRSFRHLTPSTKRLNLGPIVAPATNSLHCPSDPSWKTALKARVRPIQVAVTCPTWRRMAHCVRIGETYPGVRFGRSLLNKTPTGPK